MPLIKNLCLISYLRNHLYSHENQNFNISPDLSWPKRGLWIPVKKVRNPSYFGPLFSSLLEVEAEDFLSRLISHRKLLGSRRSFQGILFVTPSLWWKFIVRFEIMTFSDWSCLWVHLMVISAEFTQHHGCSKGNWLHIQKARTYTKRCFPKTWYMRKQPKPTQRGLS